ncbi:MAG TPA: cation transporter, partial [Pasteurellaceae bacterium]|nr:cation transporter [Pasteurellaceae bacterium]
FAAIGLVVNIVVARMMMKTNQENINIRAAYLHVLADLFGSVVAIISGLSAYFFGWNWVDPTASLILSVIIFRSGWQVTVAATKALRSGEKLETDSHSGHRH